MDKQHKKVLVYALALFLAAAVLIAISAFTQGRVSKEREEELKTNLTTDITERLQQTMQQNIDQINEENTKLKGDITAKDEEIQALSEDIERLRSEVNTLNSMIQQNEAKLAGLELTDARMAEMKEDIAQAMDYYEDKKDSKAETVIRALSDKLETWTEEDAKAKTP